VILFRVFANLFSSYFNVGLVNIRLSISVRNSRISALTSAAA